MTPIWAWARSELRRGRRGALGLVLLIGLSGAVVLVAAAGSRRTATAFERFMDDSRAADVQLQYSDEEVAEGEEEALAPTPAEATATAAERAEQDAAVLAAYRDHPDIVTAEPVHFTFLAVEGSEYELSVLNGPAGLFRDIDVPRIVEGRAPDPTEPHEVVVNRFVTEVLGVGPGDEITAATFTREQFGPFGPDGPPAGPELSLKVTGVAVTPYDLADPEFPGMYGTAAFYDAYHQRLASHGPSLQIATTGDSVPARLVADIAAPFDLEEVIIGTSDDQMKKVADGTNVLATGLAAFAAVAALASIVACVQALQRRAGGTAMDLPALGAMGLTRTERAAAMTLSVVPIVVAGLIVAVLLAIVGSVLMPIGAARQAEPHPGLDIDVSALVGAASLGGTILLAAVTATSWRANRGSSSAPERSLRQRPVVARGVRSLLAPPGQVGVAMALDPGTGRARVPVRSALIGAVVGVTGVIAVFTFGAGLDHLTTEPEASGWSWTLRPSLGDDDEEADNLATLLDVPGVEDVGRLGIGQVNIEGRDATGFSMRAEAGSPTLAVLRGRMPASSSEVALGPELASSLGVGTGDEVRLEQVDRPLTMVGEVLVPTFDDNAFNEGVVIATDQLDDLRGDEGFDEFVVTFDPSVSEAEAATRIEAAIPGAMSIYSYPTLPPDVANLESVRFLPSILAAFLALLALAAVTHALVTSVRRRRIDLGIVRTFGFATKHVMRTVVIQSVTWALVGVVLGIPLGVVTGRLIWRAVAGGIGVAGTSPTPAAALLAVTAVVVAASAAVALLPGRSAGRMRAVDALRVE